MKRLGAVMLVLALAGLPGCKETSESGQQVAPKASINSADDVVSAFSQAGLKLTDIRSLTAESDTNNLLGRPGQYTSKVFFYDARHPKVGGGDDTGENTVEVFASAADAKARHDYIEGVTKGMAVFAQYQILQGRVLVRLDKVLLPAEAEQYKAALSKQSTD